VGSIRGYADNGTAYIRKLIVKSNYQNKGIGKMLMDSIEQNFDYCNRFELFTGHKSLKNIYLYNKLGYKEFKQQIINNNITLLYLDKTKHQ
jgi:ribosomal protein S18 acetylase RimI-like enzyme